MNIKNFTQKIKEEYQQKFNKFGIDPRSLFWASKGAAHQRFRQMWAEIDFDGKSVLDVGCGFGEMAKFLDKRYKIKSYTGTDIVPEFVAEAKKLYPHHSFLVNDFINEEIPGKYDVVLASGILNSNVSDNMEYRKKAISILFGKADYVLAFNMLGAHPQPETNSDSNVWYADSLEILKYCMTLTRRVIFRHHYNPKDFTILMYKTKEK